MSENEGAAKRKREEGGETAVEKSKRGPGPPPDIANLKADCPGVFELLGDVDFDAVFDRCTFDNDEHYWQYVEMRFFLISLRLQATDACRLAVADGKTAAGRPVAAQPILLRQTVDSLLPLLDQRASAALAASTFVPRLVRLAGSSYYSLTDMELSIFQAFVLKEWSPRAADIFSQYFAAASDESSLMEDLQRILRMNMIEWQDFAEETRPYIKDATIVIQAHEWRPDKKMVKLSIEVVRALTGAPLTKEMELKLSGTKVLTLLEDDGVVTAGCSDSVLAETIEGAAAEEPNEDEQDHGEEDEELGSEQEEEPTQRGRSSSIALDATSSGPDGGGLVPYTSNLQYVDDCFKVLREQIKLSQIWQNEDMKSSGADHTQNPWEKSKVPLENKHELEAKIKINQTRIDHRLRLTEAAAKTNPKVSMPSIHELARHCNLDRFEHGVVVLLIAHSVAPMIRSLYSSGHDIRGSDLRVKQCLTFFCATFKEQVEMRPAFYKTSRLVKSGVVKVATPSWSTSELGECSVTLDRHTLETALGLQTEISEVVQGSNMYLPTVSMDRVILPDDQKALVMETVANFEKFKAFRAKQLKGAPSLAEPTATLESCAADSDASAALATGILVQETAVVPIKKPVVWDADNVGPVGVLDSGLVVLLCGPSGTGKTLTVNAVANLLGKRVLLVNFQVMVEPLAHRRGRLGDSEEGGMPDLLALFREAETQDAVLFFDECESLFAARGAGGSAQTTALLTVMERFQGLVFLATNRQFDLDEAMHRRIHYVFNFRQPNHVQRRRIWQLHTTKDGLGTDVNVGVEEGINWDEIALRYELSGGFIKNAVLSSLMMAISRDGESPVITEADIHSGCAVQMRGSLQMRQFDSRCVPTAGLPKLVLDSETRKQIHEVVMFEKARSVLFGEWGYGDIDGGAGDSSGMGEQQGAH